MSRKVVVAFCNFPSSVLLPILLLSCQYRLTGNPVATIALLLTLLTSLLRLTILPLKLFLPLTIYIMSDTRLIVCQSYSNWSFFGSKKMYSVCILFF